MGLYFKFIGELWQIRSRPRLSQLDVRIRICCSLPKQPGRVYHQLGLYLHAQAIINYVRAC